MLPDEYRIDDATARRLEQEMGQPLPDGAIEGLYQFETENREFADAVLKRDHGPEFTWLRAMLLAKLGPLKYAMYWRDLMARELRQLQRQMGIPRPTEYRIDGFHIRNIGPQPVEEDGEWYIKNCWRITDDGAENYTMDVWLDDDDGIDVESILRQLTSWTRQIQAEDEDHL
jgi:hypothetical protein